MSQLEYQRLDDLLNYLIQQDFPISLDTLSQVIKVSTRTLRSDIKKINEYITSYGAEVQLIRKKGYIIQYSNKEQFDTFWDNDQSGTFLFTTAESRLEYLLRIFLTSDDFVKQNDLLNLFFISQNTLYNDLRNLKNLLSIYNLKVINKSNLGYTLEGEEENIRLAISSIIFQSNLDKFISNSSSIVKDVCINITYDSFDTIYQKTLGELISADSDYFHRNAFSKLLLALSRIKEGHTIPSFSKTVELIPFADIQIKHFIQQSENYFDIKISQPEQKYFEYILSENFPHIISNNLKQNNVLASKIVSTLISNLKKRTSASWVSDETLKVNLTEHISRLLSVHTIEGIRENPILEAVKNNFPYPFDLAVTEIQKIEKQYDLIFSEDEISYIALYFASAIESNPNDQEELSLLIVCGTGITLSSIIESKIKKRFPNQFRAINKTGFLDLENHLRQNCFDIIISTIPINEALTESQIVYLDIDNFESAFDHIESLIKTTHIPSLPLYKKEHFLLIQDNISKHDLFKKISEILMEQDYVSNQFYDELLQREAVSSTAINDLIALPHPIGPSVKTSTIFPIIAPKGIEWENKKRIKFIFIMAIKPEDISQSEYIYDEILDFMSSKKKQNELLATPTFDSLLSILSL